MMAKKRVKGKKVTATAPSINPRIILLCLVVTVCFVVVWMYLNRDVKETNAASPESRPVITRPIDDPVRP